MAAFSTIALATAATVSAVGTVASASAQSKAAKKAAAADEANAQAAEQNAEALAEAVEGTTKFNYAETVRDADLTKQRTLLELEQIARTGAFSLGQIDRETSATRHKAEQEEASLLLDRTHTEQLLALRGDADRRDTADEVGRLLGIAEYERGALTREAGQTLNEAALAITAVREKAAMDAMTYGAQANEANAQAAYATRRAASEQVLAAQEERRQRVQSARTLGAARAAAAAGGVAVSGSALDVLADTRGQAEIDALTIRYEGQVKADSYLEDARQQGARATLLRQQAANSARIGELSAQEIRMKADFQAAELRRQADETVRRAGENASIARHQSANRQAEYALQTQQAGESADLGVAAVWQQAGDRLGDLDASRAQTAADYSVMYQTTKFDGEEQEAALRREADMIQWKGEIDSRNTRLTGYQQAAEYRTSAAARRSQAGSIMTAGLFNAGATLISGAGQVYSSWGGSGRSGNNGSGR